jgi:hypothetical protein
MAWSVSFTDATMDVRGRHPEDKHSSTTCSSLVTRSGTCTTPVNNFTRANACSPQPPVQDTKQASEQSSGQASKQARMHTGPTEQTNQSRAAHATRHTSSSSMSAPGSSLSAADNNGDKLNCCAHDSTNDVIRSSTRISTNLPDRRAWQKPDTEKQNQNNSEDRREQQASTR